MNRAAMAALPPSDPRSSLGRALHISGLPLIDDVAPVIEENGVQSDLAPTTC